MSESLLKTTVLRSALRPYIALASVWMVLGLGYVVLTITRPWTNTYPVAVICFSIGVLWITWLQGFRIRLSQEQLEYRDGFYRRHRVALQDIVDVKTAYTSWFIGFREMRTRRLLIRLSGAERECLEITEHVFHGPELNRLVQHLRQVIARTSRGD